jgi:D-lactate dehydrogenase (cytochrome)
MEATNKYGMSKRKWPERDSLFFKFQGPSAASLRETAEIVKEIVQKHGATGFEFANDDKEAEGLWADRKNAHFAGLALVEGARGWPTDVWSVFQMCPMVDTSLTLYDSVPVSKLPELVYETKKDLAQIGITSTIVGHVGDGNFHALLLFRTDEEMEIAKEAVHRMVERAIKLDGTCKSTISAFLIIVKTL